MTPFEQGYWYTMKCAGIRDRVVAAGGKALDSFRALRELPSAHRGIGEAAEESKRLSTHSDNLRSLSNQHADRASAAARAGDTSKGQAHMMRGQEYSRHAGDYADRSKGVVNEAQNTWDATKQQAMPAGVAIGVGVPATVAGATYLGGDADTTSNRMKNLANDRLGTNFSTQSRLGAMFG